MSEQNLKKNMIWNAAGNLIYMACQWVVTVLVTNLGSFYDAGVLSIAMSVSATFRTLALFGIRNYQVSDIENRYSDTCYVFFRIITCSVSLLFCMGFALVADYSGEQILAIFLFMMFHLAENFSDVLHGIAQKNGRLDVAGQSFAIKGIGLLLVFFTCYKLTGNLNAGLFAMALLSWMSTLLFDVLVVKRLAKFSFVARQTKWGSLAKETAPLCVYLFLSAAMMTVPKLILERQSGEVILGAYSSIFAPALLIQAAMGYIYNPFAQMLGQHRQNGDRKAFLTLSAKLSGAIAVLTVLMIVAAHFLGEWGLTLIFGETILPYVNLFIPILCAVAAVAFFSFLCMLATVLRDFVWLLISCAVGVAIEIFLTAPWISHAGTNATSYSCILAAGLASVILLAHTLWILLRKEKRRV